MGTKEGMHYEGTCHIIVRNIFLDIYFSELIQSHADFVLISGESLST